MNLLFFIWTGCQHFFSKIKTGEIFYGFDSFEGLPETWKIGFEKGRFSQINLPPVPSNVELIKGWFEDSIPNFKISNNNNTFSIQQDINFYISFVFYHL